ncbi:hypothetical protein M2139_000212 [Enterococcus sp. PF1-24]|uniref:hypothetical protein n=1 Tax=unclassified Enterococcus TaxID=2608891 RepID=UPI0024730B2C|nr:MULTISPECIES: hypothetical protein [unclassified Enterococcus]MDH6363368.1 hypothetical protein [Enterococcus sp. PFB1-1]MDH6400331.1 hypothetical protein [Enterococcus sp. PF1-24]
MNGTFRDLTILPLSTEKNLVIACDSSAAIGEKTADQVKIAPEIMAAYCLRVPLMEIFCFGGAPLCVVDLIGNELNPTGTKMLKGIQEELIKANLADLPLNGSTEENMTTQTTSIGVTVIGEVAADFSYPQVNEGAVLFQLGTPYVGDQVVANINQIFSYDIVQKIRQETAVLDMLPVGSKGIAYEANQMAKTGDCQVEFFTEENLKVSAGPATVVLIAIQANQELIFSKKYPQLKKIGRFYKENR